MAGMAGTLQVGRIKEVSVVALMFGEVSALMEQNAFTPFVQPS